MPAIRTITAEDRELGKLLAERANLDPNAVREDWDMQSDGDEVTFTFHVISKMPRAEWEALVARHEKSDARLESRRMEDTSTFTHSRFEFTEPPRD